MNNSTTTDGRRRVKVVCIVLVVLVAVLAPRIWHLERRSVWYDEAASWRTASMPVPEMLKSLAANVHPPLYFFGLKLWSWLFGDSETALRAMAVLWGLAAAAAVGLLVASDRAVMDQIEGRAAQDLSDDMLARSDSWSAESVQGFRAVLAVTFYALSPIAVRYAREARMYTLATCLVVGGAWLLVEGLQRRKLGYLWASALVLSAGAYTHYYVLFHCIAQCLYLLIQAAKHRWWQLLPPAFFPFIAFVPWAGVLLGQTERVGTSYWISPLTWERAGNLLLQLWTADDGDHGWVRAVAGAGLMIVCLGVCWRRGGPVGRLATWHCAVTFGLALFLSVTWKAIAIPRYFVPAHALLVCGLASAWPASTWIGRAVTLNVFASLLVLLSLLWPRLDPPSNVPGMRGAVAWAEEQRQADEIVLVERPFLYLPWRYYDRTSRVYLTDEAVSRLTHYEGLPLLTADEQTGGNTHADAAHRIWFVREPYSRSMPPFQDDGWTRSGSRDFPEAFPWQSAIRVECWVHVSHGDGRPK